jgi:UPF0042 nucleotide-binding protein
MQDLVLVTGMSGAGKSTAMQVFEDAGYFCVDNLPPEMLEPLADLFENEGSTVDRACVVSDTRGGEYFERLSDVLDGMPIKPRILFLDADDQTLLTRFKETRRRHPLARNGNVNSGIDRERELLEPLRVRADDILDTTAVAPAELRRRIARKFLDDQPGQLAVTFTSFGHKHGPSRDADLAFDVRFLPNPHYVDDLRPLTGFDPRVVEHVARDGRLAEFYDRLLPLLDYLLPQYISEGKSHLVVAIGCTGGRHRSVAIAEHLAARYREDGRFNVEVLHRDLDRAHAHRAGPDR